MMMTDTDRLDEEYLAVRRESGWEQRAVLAEKIFDLEQEFRLQLKYSLTSDRGNGILFGLQMARDIVAGEA